MQQGTDWTPPLTNRLRTLLQAGLAYAKAAAVLSHEFRIPLTRNACIGKANRHNMLKGRPPTKYSLNPGLRNAPAVPRKRRKKVRPAQPIGTFLLEQLEADMCRWPSGDCVPYFFCGAPQLEGCSYCEAHALIGFTKR